MQTLRKQLDGDLDIRAVLQMLDFKNHPDHLSGRKSKATLFGEFSDLIASNAVSWQAFQLYCRGIATCTNESDFMRLVRACDCYLGSVCHCHLLQFAVLNVITCDTDASGTVPTALFKTK